MRVTIEGVETFYQQMGQGKPLVLLHGWGCDWQIWHPIITTLTDQFQVILPDLPAFGQSANPPIAWNSMAYVEWLAKFLEHVGGDHKLSLVGHSFGGKIAALYAVKYPDKVDRLVLIDASGIPDGLTPMQSAKQALISLVPETFKSALSPTRRAKILNTLGVSSDYSFSTSAQREILQQVVRENIGEQLSLITKPTLLIWGQNDLDTPVHQARRFQQAISKSQLVILPNVGHFPFIDQPSTVLKHLQEFLT